VGCGPWADESRVTRLSRVPFLPTRRLAAAVALAAPVWLLAVVPGGAAVAAAVVALLALAALADALLLPSAREVTVERAFPETIGVGDVTPGEYRLRSSWPRPVRVALFDDLPDAIARLADATRAAGAALAAGEDAARAVAPPSADSPASAPPASSPVRASAPAGTADIPAGGAAAIAVTLAGRTRGAWPLGAVALRAVGPLGLVQRTLRYPWVGGRVEDDAARITRPRAAVDGWRSRAATLRSWFSGGAPRASGALRDTILVTPSIAGVRRFRLLALQHRLRDAGLRTIRRRGEGTSFAGLREYVVGDDPRHVDWKASARRATLITREYTVEQGQTVLIAVDAGLLMTQLAGALPRFEYALASALVLADVAASASDYVGCVVFDDQIRALVPPARGRAALRLVRDALVPMRATMAEPDYALAFRTLAARHRKRSLVVLFSDVIDVRASQSLIAHTARSAARHLPLVVAMRNDALAAAAAPTAASSSRALFESAAAEELLSARDDALQRMRRAGVAVVDVSPSAMTAAVINRYLEIKARAAL
jgi:uncharacterized protein (DUF58 family)